MSSQFHYKDDGLLWANHRVVHCVQLASLRQRRCMAYCGMFVQLFMTFSELHYANVETLVLFFFFSFLQPDSHYLAGRQQPPPISHHPSPSLAVSSVLVSCLRCMDFANKQVRALPLSDRDRKPSPPKGAKQIRPAHFQLEQSPPPPPPHPPPTPILHENSFMFQLRRAGKPKLTGKRKEKKEKKLNRLCGLAVSVSWYIPCSQRQVL